jgi:transposase InsO family protein
MINQYEPRYMQLVEKKLRNIIKKKQNIVDVSKELSVSRPTIYKWLSRYKKYGINGILQKRGRKKGIKATNRTPDELEQLVVNLAKEYPFDGVQTLADHLEYEYNTILHPTTIYRILQRENIRYTEYYPRTRKKWKKQLFSHSLAGQEPQMDTKYPFGYKQGKVVYTIIDDASRWVFVWSYDTANANNTVDFVRKVIQRAPFTIQKIRTDQGTEFVNDKLTTLLKEYDIIHRKNTPYCPEENGKIERFHRTLNQKALQYGFSPNESLDSLQYKLNLFLHYYNYRKKHRGLGMDGLTPIQKLIQLSSVNISLQCYNY